MEYSYWSHAQYWVHWLYSRSQAKELKLNVVTDMALLVETKYGTIWNLFSRVNWTIFAIFGKIPPYFLYHKFGN